MAKSTTQEYQHFLNYGKVIDFNDKQKAVNFYCKQMSVRSSSMFKYTNLPETIPEKVLELMLQRSGYVIITKVTKDEITRNKDIYTEGIYAFSNVGLGGEPDVYYRPTKAIIVNPALGLSIERTINKDCVLLRNDSLLMGLYELNSRYASLLAENDITFKLYDINSRIQTLVSSLDDNVAESARLYFKDIENGKLGIISDSALLDALKTSPYATSTDKFKGLIEYQQYLKASWLNEIGLNANYNMKREALNSSETGVNEASLLPFVDNMLECREQDLELLNSMYGLNIEVRLNSSWETLQKEVQEDLNNEEIETPTKEGEE